jgi:Fe-S cluster assembly protein SufD
VTEVMEQGSPYLADFERFEKEHASEGGPALHRLRKGAIAQFAEKGFPGPRDEEWRFTNVAPLAKVPFELIHYDHFDAPESYRLIHQGDSPGSLLLCVNGYRPILQHQGPALPTGVVVGSLSEAFQSHPEVVSRHLARHADYKAHAFAALNAAFLRDGAFVYVPRGVVIEEPINLHFLVAAFGRPFVWYRRCLVVVESGSQVKLVENYSGLPGTSYLTNAVTEIVVGEGAHVDHYKVQQEGDEAAHVATMQVQQARDSRFASHAITLGGHFVRNEVNAVLDAEACECTLNGLYLAAGKQLVDNHTFIDHSKPHCASHELYKGILDGQAKGVFNGKIYVRQDAQKTDAKQTNKTLLLSDDATINTKPQLEIYADDVKCTHGATVGQLDAEAIFYLRARGIGCAEARQLLTYAFANDIISRIQIDTVRRRLEEILLQASHLPAAEAAEEDT